MLLPGFGALELSECEFTCVTDETTITLNNNNNHNNGWNEPHGSRRELSAKLLLNACVYIHIRIMNETLADGVVCW